MPVVYLLHFDEPYPNGRRPQHYIGVAQDFDARIHEHRSGSSKGRLTRALFALKIGFQVARTWEYKTSHGAFEKERSLKRRRRHKDHCPLCKECP